MFASVCIYMYACVYMCMNKYESINDEWVSPKYFTATHFMVKWLNHWKYAYVIYILILIFLKTLSHSNVESYGGRQVFIHRFLFGEHWAGRAISHLSMLEGYMLFISIFPYRGISYCAAAFVLYLWSLIIWLFFLCICQTF